MMNNAHNSADQIAAKRLQATNNEMMFLVAVNGPVTFSSQKTPERLGDKKKRETLTQKATEIGVNVGRKQMQSLSH